jgi:hypothetical protein
MDIVNSYVEKYNAGLTIRDIAKEFKTSYESVRKILKSKVNWKRKYVSDFTEEQIVDVVKMFDDGVSIADIAKVFRISEPVISRLLVTHDRKPICSAKKYNALREIEITPIQQQFVIGHLLGDGCIYRDRANSMYKVSISQCEKQAQYFHWKCGMMAPFVKAWRTNIDKRGNSIMLNAATICHPEFAKFAEMFYAENRIKIVPKNLDKFMTPLALAIWIMDDGGLNAGVNMRIATMQFSYDGHIELQSLLKRCFDLDSKIMDYNSKNKTYNQLVLDKENTQKLSDIIRIHVVSDMQYKIMAPLS